MRSFGFFPAFSLVSVLVLSAGCTPISEGDKTIATLTTAQVESAIQDKVTTMDDVKAKFGEPQDRSVSANGEVWRYYYRKATNSAGAVMAQAVTFGAVTPHTDYESTDLVIYFDKNSVVTKHDFLHKQRSWN
ncbi:MAG: hypothetical protein LBG06_04650 [Deltaproteobacteria bacterium]|nr:hypothetical protein [Deltaproteobacteria bacterium]